MLRKVIKRGPDLFKTQPSSRFVLFGAERCGSVLLLNLLRQSTTVHCDRNLLSKPYFFPLWHIHRHALQSKAAVYSFKLSSQDLIQARISEPEGLLTLLHKQGYEIVHLRRQDILRHSIALLKAQTEAQSAQTSRQLKRQPLYVNPDQLLKIIQHLETQRLEEAAMLVNVPCLRLTYEADLLDSNIHDTTARRLCSYLDIDFKPSPPPAMKLVHQQLEDLIANYKEVCEALKSADYGYVLAKTAVQLAI